MRIKRTHSSFNSSSVRLKAVNQCVSVGVYFWSLIGSIWRQRGNKVTAMSLYGSYTNVFVIASLSSHIGHIFCNTSANAINDFDFAT